jgi:hypothetical protein
VGRPNVKSLYVAQQILITASPVGWDGPTLNLTDGAPATGTFLEVALDAEESTVTPVMAGGGVINMFPSTSGRMTVTLVASAVQNNALSDARRDQKKEGSPRAWALQAKDGQGFTVHSCPFAVIQGAPVDTFSETVPSRVWVFLCPQLDMDHRESKNLGD